MFLCCVVCERYLPHILSWNVYQQERQLMTIISFHPCNHKNRASFVTFWVHCVSIVWKCQQKFGIIFDLQRNKCSIFSQNRFLLAI